MVSLVVIVWVKNLLGEVRVRCAVPLIGHIRNGHREGSVRLEVTNSRGSFDLILSQAVLKSASYGYQTVICNATTGRPTKLGGGCGVRLAM